MKGDGRVRRFIISFEVFCGVILLLQHSSPFSLALAFLTTDGHSVISKDLVLHIFTPTSYPSSPKGHRLNFVLHSCGLPSSNCFALLSPSIHTTHKPFLFTYPNYEILIYYTLLEYAGITQSIYRLADGMEIESRCEERISAPGQTVPEAHPASCTMGTGSFATVNRSACGVDHPPL